MLFKQKPLLFRRNSRRIAQLLLQFLDGGCPRHAHGCQLITAQSHNPNVDCIEGADGLRGGRIGNLCIKSYAMSLMNVLCKLLGRDTEVHNLLARFTEALIWLGCRSQALPALWALQFPIGAAILDVRQDWLLLKTKSRECRWLARLISGPWDTSLSGQGPQRCCLLHALACRKHEDSRIISHGAVREAEAEGTYCNQFKLAIIELL
mmetsp:Transcript_28184/g.58508  ORF Transcript_28184/g.58508 Transcript_28184/m.58508 type:complete len:207 (-) Transcript_28184:86-706(-)